MLLAAIEAHGGLDRLSRVESVKLEIHGVRTKPYAQTVLWRDDGSWVSRTNESGAYEALGMTRGECWRQNALRVVLPCDEAHRRAAAAAVVAMHARMLHPLLGEQLAWAGRPSVGGADADMVRTGALSLAFHATTHLLLQLATSAEGHTRTETATEYVEVEGVRLASHIVTAIDGRIVDDAMVTEASLDAVPSDLLAVPDQVEDGGVFVKALPPKAGATLAGVTYLGSQERAREAIGAAQRTLRERGFVPVEGAKWGMATFDDASMFGGLGVWALQIEVREGPRDGPEPPYKQE